MAKFFFDTHDGEDFSQDTEGIECRSREELQHLAVSVLPDLARDELPDGPNRTFWVKVRDVGGREVFEASLVLSSNWIAEPKMP